MIGSLLGRRIMQNDLKTRSAIDSMKVKICLIKLRAATIKREFLLKEYNPNQPRLPAGQTGAGRWTDGNAPEPSSVRRKEDGQEDPLFALAASQEDCDEQYRRDLIVCKFTDLRACYARAMVRLVACERGHPIPPLNF